MNKDIAAIIDNMKHKKRLDVGLLSDDDSPCVVTSTISTGCLVLDRILGGGLPVGRMTEFYGEPSSGKSLIASQCAAVAQEAGIIVAYADTEAAVSIGQMKRLGVDVDSLIYATPDTAEEIFSLLDELIDQTSKVDKQLLFIWDSVAATSSKAELEKDYGETGYLTHARVISQGLRKIMRQIAKSQVALLFLNQTREKLGVMFGDSESTFGGKAIPFHASVRVRLSLSSKIKVGTKRKIAGVNVKALTVKNKLVAPYQTVTLPVHFYHGIDDDMASYYWLKEEGYVTGTNWQVMTIGDKEVKFQTVGWKEVYEENYDYIADIIMGDESLEAGEVEEYEEAE